MGLPAWPYCAPQERVLCTEIERMGRNVWSCKLFHTVSGQRAAIFSRTLVNGNRTEAKRVMAALYELQKIKEAG